VKKQLVATYGISAVCVSSVLGANTLKVQQHPSTFSTLNTSEHVTPISPHSPASLDVGILHGVPLHPQVYSLIGRVLKQGQLTEQPKNPLSQVSRQQSFVSAFCCKIHITVRISDMQLQPLLLLLLHI